MAQETSAVRVRVTGRVQGVGFRAWTQDEAERRGLSGWVRNEDDGSVAALLVGPFVAVEEMVGALRKGPLVASVDDVEVRPADDEAPRGFRVTR